MPKTKENIDQMKKQLKLMGFSIDWSREFATCDEDYYKHQQLFFLELYDKGLVYKKENYTIKSCVHNVVVNLFILI